MLMARAADRDLPLIPGEPAELRAERADPRAAGSGSEALHLEHEARGIEERVLVRASDLDALAAVADPRSTSGAQYGAALVATVLLMAAVQLVRVPRGQARMEKLVAVRC